MQCINPGFICVSVPLRKLSIASFFRILRSYLDFRKMRDVPGFRSAGHIYPGILHSLHLFKIPPRVHQGCAGLKLSHELL